MAEGTVALRICQEGHANALALNKDSTQIAVAGRSRELISGAHVCIVIVEICCLAECFRNNLMNR